MIKCDAEAELVMVASRYKAMAVTGPGKSGKMVVVVNRKDMH